MSTKATFEQVKEFIAEATSVELVAVANFIDLINPDTSGEPEKKEIKINIDHVRSFLKFDAKAVELIEIHELMKTIPCPCDKCKGQRETEEGKISEALKTDFEFTAKKVSDFFNDEPRKTSELSDALKGIFENLPTPEELKIFKVDYDPNNTAPMINCKIGTNVMIAPYVASQLSRKVNEQITEIKKETGWIELPINQRLFTACAVIKDNDGTPNFFKIRVSSTDSQKLLFIEILKVFKNKKKMKKSDAKDKAKKA